jgi:hypothetical protein
MNMRIDHFTLNMLAAIAVRGVRGLETIPSLGLSASARARSPLLTSSLGFGTAQQCIPRPNLASVEVDHEFQFPFSNMSTYIARQPICETLGHDANKSGAVASGLRYRREAADNKTSTSGKDQHEKDL